MCVFVNAGLHKNKDGFPQRMGQRVRVRRENEGNSSQTFFVLPLKHCETDHLPCVLFVSGTFRGLFSAAPTSVLLS